MICRGGKRKSNTKDGMSRGARNHEHVRVTPVDSSWMFFSSPVTSPHHILCFSKGLTNCWQKHSAAGFCSVIICKNYHLVMTFTVCHGKIHHAMNSSVNHLWIYGPWLNHGELSAITRGYMANFPKFRSQGPKKRGPRWWWAVCAAASPNSCGAECRVTSV